ncbi:MAG: hypothetical protein U9N07_01910 [Euryarchaeota archaeon]|nr:hypothetical protein [Euryarchaeota archaeon]
MIDIVTDSETTETSFDIKIPGDGIVIRDEIELIDAVIAKHRQFFDTYQSEFGVSDSQVSKLRESSGEEKRARDEINEHVAGLKERRQLLYHQAKQHRIEMFDLININRDMQKDEQEMARLQKEVEMLDWKLQTTVMGIRKERELVEKIKKLSLRIEEINDDRPIDGADEEIKQLSAQIKEMMEEADECHKELVLIADQSQEHHGSFIEYAEQLKGVRGRHIWLQSRIKSHKAAIDYWESKQREMTAGGDNGD